MAKKIISHDDLFEPKIAKGIIKELDDLIVKGEETEKTFKSILKVLQDIEGIKTAEEFKAFTAQSEKLTKAQKELVKTEEKLAKVQERIIKDIEKQAEANKKLSKTEKGRLGEIKLAKAREKAFDDFEKKQQKGIKTKEKQRLAEIKLAKARDDAFKKADSQGKKAIANAEKERIAQLKLASDRKKAFDKADAAAYKSAKAAEKLKKANLDNANAFKKLEKQVNSAQARFKRLSAQYGSTAKITIQAQRQFEKLDDRLRKINKSARDGRRDVGRYGLALQKVKGFLSGGLGALGLAGGIATLTRGIGNAIGIFKDFEKANSNLKAILGESGTEGAMQTLSDSAKQLGATTAFTASEVVSLQIEFAKLGLDPAGIDNATASTLALASASGTELADAAAVAGATLGGFGLGAEETARVVDVMAKSFSISALDMEKFKESMKSAAPAAEAVGVSVEKTTALLGTLANAGISGSKAGNNLKTSFINLNAAGLTLEEGLEKVAKSEDKLGTAAKLVGKNAAASFLVLAKGVEVTENLETGLLSSAGAAQEMADTQLDNLAGSLTILNSAWEGFILSLEDGEGAFAGILRTVVDVATELLSMATGTAAVTESLDEAGLRIRNIAKNVVILAKVIKAVVIGFVAYKTAVIASTLASKAYAVITKVVRIAKIALARGTKLATTQMKLFNTASKANILGALAAAVLFVVSAFIDFTDTAKELADAQNKLNDELRKNNKALQSKEERLRILHKLNKRQLIDLLSDIEADKERLKLNKKITDSLEQIEQGERNLANLRKGIVNDGDAQITLIKGLVQGEQDFIAAQNGITRAEKERIPTLGQLITKQKELNESNEQSIKTSRKGVDILDEQSKRVQAALDALKNKTNATNKLSDAEEDLIKIQLAKQRGIDPSITNQTDQELQARTILGIELERLGAEKEFKRRERAAIEELDGARLDAALLVITQDRLDKEEELLRKQIKLKKRALRDDFFFKRTIEMEASLESVKLEIETERKKEIIRAKSIKDPKKRADEIARINKQADEDKRTEILKFNNNIELEHSKHNNELLSLDIELQQGVTDLSQQRVDNEKAANDKILLNEIESAKKRKEENTKIVNSITNEYINALSKRNDAENASRDAAIAKQETSLSIQEQRAKDGLSNTLAFEQQELDKARLAKQQELERQAKEQEIIALVQAYYNQFQSLSSDPERADTAAVDAFTNTLLAKSIAKGLTGFIDGTELVSKDMGGSKFSSGQDGYVAKFDGRERILNPSQNMALPKGMSNEELVQAAKDYSNGNTWGFMPTVAKSNGSNDSAKAIIESNKQVIRAIENNAASMSVDSEGIMHMMESRVSRGKKELIHFINKKYKMIPK